MPFLDEILSKKDDEIRAAKQERNIGDLKRMFRDAPPLRSFRNALSNNFGLIAEVKRKSPSVGNMRAQNVEDAPAAYSKSPIVRAVSVLTDTHFFGMSIEHLRRIKTTTHKPVLRKDFIVKAYQIYEARAFGADAVLLMANVLGKDGMARLFDLVRELGMDALIEVHTKEEIDWIPSGATICGINSRKFMAQRRWKFQKLASRLLGRWRPEKKPDFSLDFDAFKLIKNLPPNAIHVAESGVKPNKAVQYRDQGFHAVLVGTSILTAERGVQAILSDFEKALTTTEHVTFGEMAHAT